MQSKHFTLQLGVICTGFSVAGSMISRAFWEWSEYPVVTNMESIAAPITNIQFPTVTVCKGEHEIPDSWAALQTFLNYVKFNDGIESKRVKKDFSFAWKPIIDKMKGWFYTPRWRNVTTAPLLTWQFCHPGSGQTGSVCPKDKIVKVRHHSICPL